MPSLDDLEHAVGRSMPNLPADVRKVQSWLHQWSEEASRKLHGEEQAFSHRLHEAIQQFQREVMNHLAPSGRVAPGDETARKLRHPPPKHTPPPHVPIRRAGPIPVFPPPGTPLVLPPRTGFQSLSADDYAAAAKTLGCEARVIRALAKQEGRDHGFDKLNRPAILWEPKHFAQLSGHAPEYRQKYPELTHLKPKPHPYGRDGQQYTWLYAAYLINPRAALLTPSWGKFQILGSGYADAGYASVQSMVADMCVSEQSQLAAFVRFVQSKHLEQALHDKDWKAIASGYNGRYWYKRKFGPPDHQITYDQALQQNYDKLKDE